MSDNFLTFKNFYLKHQDDLERNPQFYCVNIQGLPTTINPITLKQAIYTDLFWDYIFIKTYFGEDYMTTIYIRKSD